jgi:MFS family permease
MLFGFDISSMSAIILSDQYNEFFNYPAGIVQGAIGSALAAGSVVGSAMAGFVSDYIGRRNSRKCFIGQKTCFRHVLTFHLTKLVMFAVMWWLLGTAVQTGVNGVGMLIAGRILNGICVGITSSQVPVYIAEIARKEKRGQLVIIQQLAIGGIALLSFHCLC